MVLPLERLQRQLVAAVVQEKPNVPDGGRILWNCFCELSEARTGNGFGPNPLSWAEFEAWIRVRRCPLSDAHLSIVRAMDRAWLDHAYKQKASAPDGMKAAPLVAGQFSLAAFDVMFS